MSVEPVGPARPRCTPVVPSHSERRSTSGFSPADDHLEAPLELERYLVPHPSSTFFMRVNGRALSSEGFHHGDLLVVDRAQTPTAGQWVVAAIDGELTLHKLEGRGGRQWLRGSDSRQARLPLEANDDRRLWGLVCHVIHDCRRDSERG